MDEGGPLADRVDGKSGGPGMPWGAEPVYSLLTVNRTKSAGRVAHLVSCICPLAREGLVSGHLVPPTAPNQGGDDSLGGDMATLASWEIGTIIPYLQMESRP